MLVRKRGRAYARAMRLDALRPEALRYLFGFVETPFALRLVCRALAAAGPRRTFTPAQNFALVH